ncbi:hypothetical protein FJZ17_01685 [Candidatus Pacearchaeota archaeon]|nr:hypothetical protein [Candidatus Pacearchaeota archaeon]
MRYLPETTASMGGYMLAKNGNLTDVLLTGGVYFINRMLGFSKASSALTSLGLMCAGELAQKFGILPGTYDPKDFAAAAIGTGLALVIDLVSSKINRDKNDGLIEALD